MNSYFKAIVIGSALLTVLGACTPISRSHGFISAKGSPGDIESGIDSKSSVLAKFGSPSTIGVFEENTWYYISEYREQLGYLQPKTESRTITTVQFANSGMVEDVIIYELEDGKIVSLVGRATPTRGRELTILEQLLGNVGRLPQGTLGQENLPGGAGGPRRDQ
ncbi:MAG: outer membrane protein assembly factor BamE [Robiginitomaculum sp.]|nr:outer membrane protein assembly factor BamE [Robiginitomaculum sp.]